MIAKPRNTSTANATKENRRGRTSWNDKASSSKQVHDLKTLVAQLSKLPKCKHLLEGLLDGQRRRLLLKAMTNSPGDENHRRRFEEQLVQRGLASEEPQQFIDITIRQLKSEASCSIQMLECVRSCHAYYFDKNSGLDCF